MQYGDRTSPESRAKGLASILAARPDWAALISDEDRRRILDDFAMNDEVDKGPSLISGAPVRGSEAAKAALAETTRTLYGGAQAEALALGRTSRCTASSPVARGRGGRSARSSPTSGGP